MRIGVIGCGKIARSHVTALRDIAGVKVVAVVDVDIGRARAFAATHGVPHAYQDADQMLATGLDAVTVCTPHAAHEEGVLAAARHRTHVLCEKPVALTVAQAQRMIAATRAARVRFGVLFQRRFWPAAAQIRRAIDDGRLATPICGGVVVRLNRDADYYAEPWRGRLATEGGGVLMTQAIHHIDLLQWFMGPVRRVTGRCATLVHRDLIEVEDTAAAVVEFTSGALATIQAGTTFRPGLGGQVWISDARGRTAGVTEFPEGVGFTDISTVPGEETSQTGRLQAGTPDLPLAEVHDHLAPYHARQISDFVDAVTHDREPAVTGVDAVRSLQIIEAIYASSRIGTPVDLAGD
ncbi:Gfo/Idh/MocA family protein [Phytohabitans sp. LJ34]|uniref:Gfo/Idh/MocA family protein n=1 Tax=Phytohabitans sp. LJ34 TaxID=3452217 RepID=UPI003F8A7EF8